MKREGRVTLDEFMDKGNVKRRKEIAEASPELPKGWKWVRLKDVGKYINGRAFKPEEWETEGLPIIRIQNLTNQDTPFNYCSKPVKQRYYIKDGDLLVSWSATLDAFIWNRGDAVLNQHIFKVKVNEKIIDKKFLFYAIKYILHKMKERTHGSTMKHITKGKFESLKIPLSPLEEQKRIVARIKEILSRVEEAKKLKAEARKDAEAIMQSALHDIFSKAEEKGWKRIRLKNLAPRVQYGLSKAMNAEEIGTPIIRMNNLTYDGHLDLSDLKYVDVNEKTANKYILNKGDILFNRTNSRELVGKTAVFNQDGKFVFASYLIRVVVDPNKVLPKYVCAFLNSRKGKQILFNMARPAIQMANINSKELCSISIPVAPISEQRQVISYLNELQEKVLALRNMQKETGKILENITLGVLDRAFKGEL